VAGILTPPAGVYAADAQVGGKNPPRRCQHRPPSHRAIADAPLCVEAHLVDFSGDIYDQELELTFLQKLREEQKFPSVAALRQTDRARRGRKPESKN